MTSMEVDPQAVEKKPDEMTKLLEQMKKVYSGIEDKPEGIETDNVFTLFRIIICSFKDREDYQQSLIKQLLIRNSLLQAKIFQIQTANNDRKLKKVHHHRQSEIKVANSSNFLHSSGQQIRKNDTREIKLQNAERQISKLHILIDQERKGFEIVREQHQQFVDGIRNDMAEMVEMINILKIEICNKDEEIRNHVREIQEKHRSNKVLHQEIESMKKAAIQLEKDNDERNILMEKRMMSDIRNILDSQQKEQALKSRNEQDELLRKIQELDQQNSQLIEEMQRIVPIGAFMPGKFKDWLRQLRKMIDRDVEKSQRLRQGKVSLLEQQRARQLMNNQLIKHHLGLNEPKS